MERLLMLVLLYTLIEANIHTEVRKCCAPDGILQVLSGDLSCVETSVTMEINNLRPDIWGLPYCRSPQRFFFLSLDKVHQDNLHVSYSACLDNLYNNDTENYLPIIVYCDSDVRDLADSENPLKTPRVLSANKCCPTGQYFNVAEKACVFTEDEIKFKSFLHISKEVDLLTLGVGSPACQDALVTYVIEFTDVNKTNDHVMIKAPWKDGYVDLTKSSDVENICLDIDISRNVLILRVCVDHNHCKNNTCLRKCCPEGEAYVSRTKCLKYSQNETENTFHSALADISNKGDNKLNPNDYGLLVGVKCEYSMYALDQTEKWSMTHQGYIYVDDEQRTRAHNEYCIEMFYNISEYDDGIYPLICFDAPVQEAEKPVLKLNGSLQIISIICLLITLLVYICIPSLQNLHGKTLMCHVASFIVAYTCLALITFEVAKDITYCSSLGYTLLFAFISAFSWLNVMCFDIWWTFGNTRTPSGVTKNRKQRNRFICYCCYAWGIGLVVTSLCMLMDLTEILNPMKRPGMGLERCWFRRGLSSGELIFFTGPVTIQLTVNLIFFILTSMNYNRVKNQIRKVLADPTDQRNRRFQADREKLAMNVKLFIVMGISWICEIISNMLNHFVPFLYNYKIFMIFDIINDLQGVFIFTLFVMKRNVYKSLRERLLPKNDKTISSSMSERDPHKVEKSSSNSTLMSTFAVSSRPANSQ